MTISYIAAFLGGFISLISPCSAMIIPTFAAAASKRSNNLLITTLVFSGGLILALAPLGLGASFVGQVMLTHRQPITLAIGILLIFIALFTIFGHHLPLPSLSGWLTPKRSAGSCATIFSLGLIGGLGSLACIGPILGAIMTLAFTSANSLTAFLLILSYTAGIVIPLIVISLVYQKHHHRTPQWLKGKLIKIGPIETHTSSLLAGALLLFIAYMFIHYQGSFGKVPLFSKTGILDFFFDVQDKLYTL